ncbi:MAG: YsnF/AvaK domain-containing protein [Pseudomonadota bacterium]|nr:YsnF/AvaK domain-containing protein [Pseudomonadota bacterium]
MSPRVEAKPVQQTVTPPEEQVHVERRPADRPVGKADKSAFEERTLDIRARSEEAVVEKQARVVEEVVLTKKATEHEEAIRDSVRRTDVDVEKLDAAGPDARHGR